MEPHPAAVPRTLLAIGAASAPFVALVAVAELAPGAMRAGDPRATWTSCWRIPSEGIVATDDRCPHMSAPLSIGTLDECVVDCPLHSGRFDLLTGETVQMPTTGGLDADGRYHPTWSAAGLPPKEDPPGKKAEARRLTRVRRLRYYPVRIVAGQIEVAIPA